ncbi:CRTAC1 family protein [Acidipila rosea]|uniref:VCBS repeat protein n=1 Tax=Acidipila rosea TaxID=768535 RepID=A0A4R1L772_9BACT|nr:CRTAC1 family protein [Acidipila rosea]TCK74045.1 VCBS repeat protein [Acidipila rosea]
MKIRVLLLLAASCLSAMGQQTAPGTAQMAEVLRRTYQQTDWKADPNKTAERARYYEALLKTGLSFADQVRVRLELANEQLRSGLSQESVDTLEELRTLCAQRQVRLAPAMERQLHHELAMAYLRMGEQQNCLHMHGRHSCIFPIGAAGVHRLPRGAEGAVREFTALLNENPADYESQWLLNIAYMQLGRFPQGVPAAWLVPVSLFDSEYDIGSFPDVAMQAGVAVTGHAGGVLMEDFDGDGLLDLMISSSGPMDQLRFFHNNGDGTFAERTVQAGLLGEVGGLNMVQGDFNNDGHPDVVVLRGGWWGRFGDYPFSLLRNNGDGTFSDVTAAAGLMSPAPTQTAAWADFDNDGWLDLFVGHESAPDDPHPSQLFHNNHDGTFTEVAAADGLAKLGFVKGVAWGDYNNDGRPDLYVAVLGAPNHLFRNDGPVNRKHPRADRWKFTDVTDHAGVGAPNDSFATWFFDYDNDGWPDIFVAGYSTRSVEDVGAFETGRPFHAEVPRLYRNNHDGTFSDVTRQVHLDRAILTMGANFGDLDNDGWLDLYLGTGESSYEALLPNRMFRNDGGRAFQDVTTSGGFGHLQKGHAIAFGDIENNGNEDVFEEMGGALPGDTYQSVLYRNPGHGNHWITLELEGVKSNRAAYGAEITVMLQTAHGLRHLYRTVGYGSSFGGNPLRQHIGIGTADRVDEVEVRWPSGLVQHFHNINADRAYHLREGASALQMLRWKTASIAVK